jgi:hypothetical protein
VFSEGGAAMTEDTKCLNPKSLTCDQFQTRLPELIGSEENLTAHPHLHPCPICGALLADLVSITQAAHMLFPIAEPSESVWVQIESAIEEEKGCLDPEDEEK